MGSSGGVARASVPVTVPVTALDSQAIADPSVAESGARLVQDTPAWGNVDVGCVMRGHPVFACLDDEQFGRTLAGVRVEESPPARVFFYRGEFARHFYLVLEGRVNLSVFSRSGVEKVIEFLGPGRIFGESGMFSERGCYAVTAVAATRARVARIANRDYLSVLWECPAACLSMLGHLADRVGRHVQQIECTTLDPATDRLVRLIEDRMPAEGDGPHVVRFDETRQELASFLSMKPETLSRVLRHLGAGGVVVVRGRDVHVPSRGRLLSLLGESLQ